MGREQPYFLLKNKKGAAAHFAVYTA